jgi:hypothetical protein
VADGAAGDAAAEPLPPTSSLFTVSATTPSTSTVSSKPADGVGSRPIGPVNLSKPLRSTTLPGVSACAKGGNWTRGP